MKHSVTAIVLAVLVIVMVACANQEPSPQRVEAVGSRVPVSPDRPATEDLDRVQAALLPPLLQPALRSALLAPEPRFDLSVNNAPAHQVFLSIASGTPYSMTVHPDVSGSVTLDLKDVSVTEALQLLRETYGYEYRIDGSRILILPAAIQTRVFSVGYPAGQRTGGGRGQSVARSDFWSDLASTLQAVVGSAAGRSVAVNSQAGLVVVRAMPSELRQVEGYLNAIRDTVRRQVVLEARIVEVTLNDGFKGGIDWSLLDKGRGAGAVIGGLPGSALLGLASQVQDFAELLRFLESQGKVEVLSSPRIATLNNQKAVLKVGSDDFFVTGIAAPSAGSGAAQPLSNITLRPFFSGVALDITPQVEADAGIMLHVHPFVSSVTQADRSMDLGSSIGAVTLPLARSSISEADSVLRAVDGGIVVIAGLMKVEPVPPVLPQGKVMARGDEPSGPRTAVNVKKELVILIRPRVILDERARIEDAAGVAQSRSRQDGN